MKQLLLYCRPGFEAEMAAEITAQAEALGFTGSCRSAPASGHVLFQSDASEELLQRLDFRRLIFARQLILVVNELRELPRDDRISPILTALRPVARCREFFVEAADSEAGKELLHFCRQFGKVLQPKLKRINFLKAEASQRLHLFFLASDHCLLGYSLINNSSDQYMGIRRLKLPQEAPSRATLKLEEALLTFSLQRELNDCSRCVDLGASPGGWTYQLVRRGCAVQAIDNGPMDKRLLATGRVEHRREDGFKYEPERRDKVDLLVCDMVEKPLAVSQRLRQWFANGWCDEAIFNLKLPMRQRYRELQRCLELFAAPDLAWEAKQLYHDREEVTVHLWRRG